jgi:N utilization substance protein A
MTAKQVILQRLREATDEVHFGEYAGRDGDLVTGIVQADAARAEKGIVIVDLGKIEAVLPQSEQVPGETYEHGPGSAASWCTWPRASAARRSPCPARTRRW